MTNPLDPHASEVVFSLVAMIAVTALLLSVINCLQLRKTWKKPVGNVAAFPAKGGPFCHNCAKKADPSPVHAVILPDKTYFVYRCDACSAETLTTREPGA